jgi:hypothetical protein
VNIDHPEAATLSLAPSPIAPSQLTKWRSTLLRYDGFSRYRVMENGGH